MDSRTFNRVIAISVQLWIVNWTLRLVRALMSFTRTQDIS